MQHTTTPHGAPPASPDRRLRRRRAALLALLAVLTCAAVPAVASAQARPPGTASPPDGRVAIPPTTPPTVPPTTAPPTTQPPVTLPPITPEEPPVLEPGSPPVPDCTTGQDRPAGTVPPGYVYSPTSFSGSAVDPQPDDTFVADAPGHAVYTGRFTTRTFAGREEFLVCAHVGTNTPDPALTAFATTGPGAHPATLTARAVIIDAAGGTTSYDIGDPQLSGSAVFPYSNATGPGEGFAGFWIPFTPALREPGFTVRVEVRGTPATPGGGTRLVMGADEVFVHLGPAPFARGQVVPASVGVAIDDSAVGERPTDPGQDDISSILGHKLRLMMMQRVSDMAPEPIASDWDWDPGPLTLANSGGGSVDDASFVPTAATLDIAPINATESRLQVHLAGRVNVELSVEPRSFGTFSFFAGSCGVDASVDVSMDVGFVVNLSPDGSRPEIDFSLVSRSAETTSLSSQGVVWATAVVIPHPEPCSVLNGRFESAVEKRILEKFDEINGGDLRVELQKMIEEKLQPADLANGPISTANITLPGGGFQIGSARWRRTTPAGITPAGGEEWIHAEGIDLAADLVIADRAGARGGDRFPYSHNPTATSSVLALTHERQRTVRIFQLPQLEQLEQLPQLEQLEELEQLEVARAVGAGGRLPGHLPGYWTDVVADFDLGMVVNGATVNQLFRALTAGGPVIAVPDHTLEATQRGILDQFPIGGILDIASGVDTDGDGVDNVSVKVAPSSAIMYLPTPPSGWPVTNDLNLYVPSLRISTSLPEIATVAADVRVGATATIDTSTNHLVPQVGKVDVQPRFLRLGAANAVTDPALLLPDEFSLLEMAAALIRDAVPTRVTDALRPVSMPDLKSLFDTPGFTPTLMSNLSVRTVGGGHLGVHLDLVPNPARVTVGGEFSGGGETTPPTGLTVTAIPRSFPQGSDDRVWWTVRDATTHALVYQSPEAGDVGLSRSIPMGAIRPRVVDGCTGERSMGVRITASVRRGNVTASGSGETHAGWTGRPTTAPKLCNDLD